MPQSDRAGAGRAAGDECAVHSSSPGLGGRSGEPLAQAREGLVAGAGEHGPAVDQGHLGAGLGERDRGLRGALAVAHDECAAAGVLLRVVEAVEDMLEFIARHLDPAEAAGAADGHDHASRQQRWGSAENHAQQVRRALDSFSPGEDGRDSRARHLRA